MNASPHTDPDDPLADELLDRLVDGELSPSEQRTVLEQLELSPAHWRRVGLAFLEAQALRGACHDWTVPTSAVSVVAAPSSPRRGLARIVVTSAAMLLAFVIGMNFGKPWSIATESPPVVADRASALEETEAVVKAPAVETVPVSFQYQDGAMSQPVATPVVDATSPVGQAWLRSAPSVPDRVRELLLQNGQKLEERQEWVEVDLADGRRGYLPVQEWTVSPVSLADFR